MMIPVVLAFPTRLIRTLFVEIPRDRRAAQVDAARAWIALFHEHGLASDGDDLTLLLATGMSPRRAVRALRRQQGLLADPARPPKLLEPGRD